MRLAIATAALALFATGAAAEMDYLNPYSINGRVMRFMIAPSGAVIGLELDNGSKIVWPEPYGRGIIEAIAVGDSIEVQGRAEMTPTLESVFAARTIIDVTTDKTLRLPRLRPPKPNW